MARMIALVNPARGVPHGLGTVEQQAVLVRENTAV